MSQIYDNWDRLVRSTLRREQLRLIAQRTPSPSPSPSPSRLGSLSSPSTTFPSPPSPSKIPSLLIGEAFDYREILLASNYFSDSNFIRRGRSGELFYGVLDDGTRVVIKKMDYSSPYCVSELQAFGKVFHNRLVPLLGHCSDGFLIYKYMSMEDLSSSLFRRQTDPRDENSSLESLDWISRLKIAIGAAEALCYLHHECYPPLVHRDIQASSIFLDDNCEVRLGSLGEVCVQRNADEEEEKAKKQSNFTKFLRIPKIPKKSSDVHGNSGKPATCAYDIYCFGKVLVELVTGKLGISASSDAAMDQDWLQQLLLNISIYDRELVLKIVDPSLIIDEDLLDEVWAMAIVARACLNPNSSKRPLMRYVLKALENPLRVVREEESSVPNKKAG